MKKLISILLVMLTLYMSVFADDYIDANATRVINYQGVMSGPLGVPITASKTFRFSIWTDSDYSSSDILPSGGINTSNVNFTGYFETQTIIPDAHGNFVTQIGSVVKLPYLDYKRHRYLQVEIKSVGAPDTSYELLDIDDDINNSTDRRLFSSSPYTINPNTQTGSQYEVGTKSGELALLGQGDKFDPVFIHPYSNGNTYTINNDNIAGDIKLIFGNLVDKVLKWSSSLNRFELGDSLFIWGNLANDGNTHLGNDSNDSTNVMGTLNITGTGYINGKNLNEYLEKLDTIEWNAKDDQISSEVPFTATGFISTNVKDAILELKSSVGFTDTDDQTASEVSYITSSGVTTNVASFLTSLYSQVISNTDTDDQIASEVPFSPFSGMIATNVQSAIEELRSAGFVDTDDQTASQVSFTPIPGISSSDVQDAISDLNDRITDSMGIIESHSWSFFPGTTSDPINTLNYEKAVPYIITSSGKVVSIGVVTNPGDSSADGEFVITKNDDGIFDSSKIVTSIKQVKTGLGDSNNSAFSNNPISGVASLNVSPGDILRAYHVGDRDSSSSLIVKIQQ